MTIGVTGGAGFIGSNFIFRMLRVVGDQHQRGIPELLRKYRTMLAAH